MSAKNSAKNVNVGDIVVLSYDVDVDLHDLIQINTKKSSSWYFNKKIYGKSVADDLALL